MCLLPAACLMAQEYGGPSVLSRGTVPSNQTLAAPTQFRPYISANGIYDTGLTGYSVDQNGVPPDSAGAGVEADFGLNGSHAWKHTLLNLDYRGAYRHYNHQTYYDGSDNILTLGVVRQPSRRLQYGIIEVAGTLTRPFGYFGMLAYDPAFSGLADNIFDNRIEYFRSAAQATYQQSARLSYNFTGSGFLVRRQSSALYGVTGATANADAVYRYSRYGSIGADYQFAHFGFTKAFGASDIHTVALDWALRASRHVEISLRAGGYRMESLMLGAVQLDPVVAAILGTHTGVAAFYSLNYAPVFGARLSRSFAHAMLGARFDQGVTPGNGLYLTSRQQAVSGTASYTGIRRWNFGADAGRMTMKMTGGGNAFGHYSAVIGGIGFTRSLGRHDLHLVGRFDVRRFDSFLGRLNRTQYRTTIGFAYSPGDLPLSLW